MSRHMLPRRRLTPRRVILPLLIGFPLGLLFFVGMAFVYGVAEQVVSVQTFVVPIAGFTPVLAVIYAACVLRPAHAVLVGLVCGGLFGFTACCLGATVPYIVGPPMLGAAYALGFSRIYRMRTRGQSEVFQGHRAAER